MLRSAHHLWGPVVDVAPMPCVTRYDERKEGRDSIASGRAPIWRLAPAHMVFKDLAGRIGPMHTNKITMAACRRGREQTHARGSRCVVLAIRSNIHVAPRLTSTFLDDGLYLVTKARSSNNLSLVEYSPEPLLNIQGTKLRADRIFMNESARVHLRLA
jgi:hypothetical protein